MDPQPLTEDELRALVRMLHRFAETELDQFENWRFPTTYGQVYFSMGRSPTPPATEEFYDDLSGWLH